MAEREFVFDGGPAWTVERALDLADRQGVEHFVAPDLLALCGAMQPAPAAWIEDRLTILWTMFMVARPVDPRALALWMSETGNLLADVPFDILAHSIDEAIRRSNHGFIPSVGEIRQVSTPLVADRQRHIERLTQMKAALEDTEASAKRLKRRAEIVARDQHIGRVTE